MSKVCCKALEIKPVPRNPCSPREWFPPESEPPFNACGISLRCHLLFLGVNTQITEVADPRPTPSVNRYVVRFNAEGNEESK